MRSDQSESQSVGNIINPANKGSDPDFPYAPTEWRQEVAVSIAKAEGMTLNEDHWDVVRALQEYFVRHDNERINTRELHDALDEKFHKKGGIKYLYGLLPGGPIAQGCRMAGLKAPASAEDKGFGSVV
jgi:tRNA 2-thiouridine synthesizing protein E